MKKNILSAGFCADWLEVITNFAVIRNAVIKRFHYNKRRIMLWNLIFIQRKSGQ